MEIIKERTHATRQWHEINFFLKENNEVCAGYVCDENGIFLKEENSPEAYQNYLKDCNNSNLYSHKKVWTQHYTENAIGKCECGEEVELRNEYLGACECPHCGRWHNLFGQELNPPETWSSGEDW